MSGRIDIRDPSVVGIEELHSAGRITNANLVRSSLSGPDTSDVVHAGRDWGWIDRAAYGSSGPPHRRAQRKRAPARKLSQINGLAIERRVIETYPVPR